MVNPALLAEANRVLATFAAPWQLVHAGRGLMLSRPDRHFGHQVQLRSDRLYLAARGAACRQLPGTTEQALVQLVLWLRGQPRRPLSWWRYACSVQVGLGGPETVALLAASSYPDLTACIFCGAADPGDWWGQPMLVGPCCQGGECRKVVSA